MSCRAGLLKLDVPTDHVQTEGLSHTSSSQFKILVLGPSEASTSESLCEIFSNQEKSKLSKETGLSRDVRADLIWFLLAQYYAVTGSQKKPHIKAMILSIKVESCLQTCF